MRKWITLDLPMGTVDQSVESSLQGPIVDHALHYQRIVSTIHNDIDQRSFHVF